MVTWKIRYWLQEIQGKTKHEKNFRYIPFLNFRFLNYTNALPTEKI